MKTLTVDVKSGDPYAIIIKENLLYSLSDLIKDSFAGEKIYIITDENVAAIYLEQIKTSLIEKGYNVFEFIINPGENSKNLRMFELICRDMVKKTITRTDLVLALGGGVVGDLAGFVAASYLRGIDFIQIPTSLLAQVDSSVGGKVAVDIPEGKNLIGFFYHPKAVFIDPNVLDTLPQRYYFDGMGEVIKYGILFDRLFLEELELRMIRREEIIYQCCRMKADIVKIDEFDKSVRMYLNFGHTLGHAIEAFYNFSKYTHGEGVAIGMYNITKLSEQMGKTEEGTSEKIKKILIDYNLPWEFPAEGKDGILENIKNDKKNIGGNLNLIIVNEIGQPKILKTDISFFKGL